MMVFSVFFTKVKDRILFTLKYAKDFIIETTTTPPQTKSIEDTIIKIVKDRCSVSRYGDGEIMLINRHSIEFQRNSIELSLRLQEVIKSNSGNHIVCLPDIFTNSGLQQYHNKTREFWAGHLLMYRKTWYNCIDKNKIYYNSYVTRLYYPFADKAESRIWFNNIKQIWNNRNVVIIEGEKSRLGVGNDLLDAAKSIRRILAPAENAFSKYNDIIAEANKLDKSQLILIALGPTATILAYDLSRAGYQAIDIGHIDIEYEWFLRRAVAKEKIERKYVNEAVGGKQVEEIDDEKYQSQIIAKICLDALLV